MKTCLFAIRLFKRKYIYRSGYLGIQKMLKNLLNFGPLLSFAPDTPRGLLVFNA